MTFSATSLRRLASCHSDIQVLCNALIEDYDFTVVCGHRGEEEQNKAYKEGKSTLQYPDSKHNTYPSLAVDLAPYERNGIDWGRLQSAYFAGRVVQKAIDLHKAGLMYHKLRAGLDWDLDNDIDDTKFWDAGHFELIC